MCVPIKTQILIGPRLGRHPGVRRRRRLRRVPRAHVPRLTRRPTPVRLRHAHQQISHLIPHEVHCAAAVSHHHVPH